MDRRLAAILSADVAGYTRLLAEDEAETLRVLGNARDTISRHVRERGVRLVDTAGDSALAEFQSAFEALRCGLAVQRTLADLAAPLPPERRLLYRIGLHLGDVAVDGDRIYGDGVNIAARLQTLAEPGGICVSSVVHENVRAQVDLPFVDIGEQTLKNFPRPVRALRLGNGSQDPATHAPPSPPARPSLVVLPFVNVSGDAEQEYFADGMTEDLISVLARIPELFVIGRGSSFAYKGQSPDARSVGKELGVRHVVEGSVRRAGARVRIAARMSEAQHGNEIWSGRYDRELGDVFAIQDEVVGDIVAELHERLGRVIAHTPRGQPVRADVWTLHVQARALIDLNDRSLSLNARELAHECIRRDASFARGWALIGRCEYNLYLSGLSNDSDLDRGVAAARRAIELDPEEPEAHAALAVGLALRRQADAACDAARRALELAPGNAEIQLAVAQTFNHAARYAEAIPILKAVTRLDPAQRYMHLFQLAISYNRLGRHDEAIAKHEESIRAHPDFFGSHMNLAAIQASLGNMNRAREAYANLLRLRPGFSVALLPRLPNGRDWLAEQLRKLGLPES